MSGRFVRAGRRERVPTGSTVTREVSRERRALQPLLAMGATDSLRPSRQRFDERGTLDLRELLEAE
jgi:hypothetical protein